MDLSQLAVELTRLDLLQRVACSAVAKGDLRFINVTLKIMALRVKLLGLEAEKVVD